MLDRKKLKPHQILFSLLLPLSFVFLLWIFKAQLQGNAQEEGGRPEENAASDKETEVLQLYWSQEIEELTTLVIESPVPTYAALLLEAHDGQITVNRPLIFLGEEKRLNFSLGQAAFAGRYCALAAATPALLQEALQKIPQEMPNLACAALRQSVPTLEE